MSEFLIKITDNEFNLLKNFIYNKCGIVLSEQKKSLVEGRLQRLLKDKSFTNFKQYYEYVSGDLSGNAIVDLINNITTNHTFFNRENQHFDFLFKNALPEIIKNLKEKKTNDLRIWSAGCSSGEEPYTIMTMMLDFFGSDYSYWDAGILATDISEKVLTIAKTGIYSDEKISELPAFLKQKYFKKLPNNLWKVIDSVKNEIKFAKFNLMNPQFVFKKKFHIIFCRNVMIYFDQKTRDELISKFYSVMEDGGYFFIGHSESLGRDTQFKYIKPSVYKKEL